MFIVINSNTFYKAYFLKIMLEGHIFFSNKVGGGVGNKYSLHNIFHKSCDLAPRSTMYKCGLEDNKLKQKNAQSI